MAERFGKIPISAAARLCELSSSAASLYALLCCHRNEETGQCNPSDSELRRLMNGMASSTFYRAKSELKAARWIENDGGGYELLVGDFTSEDVEKALPKMGVGALGTPKNGSQSLPKMGVEQASTPKNGSNGLPKMGVRTPKNGSDHSQKWESELPKMGVAYKEEQTKNRQGTDKEQHAAAATQPVENFPLVTGPLTAPNPNTHVIRSVHKFDLIYAFVEQTIANAHSPAGMAKLFERTGEKDKAISAWLAKREQQAAAEQAAQRAAAEQLSAADLRLEREARAEAYLKSLTPAEYDTLAAPIAEALKQQLGPEKLIRWTDEAFADSVRARLIRQLIEQQTKGDSLANTQNSNAELHAHA